MPRRYPAIGTVLLSAVLWLTADGLLAQPPESSTVLPLADLTVEQVRALPDEQLISAGEDRIAVGELREQHRARRAALAAQTSLTAAQAAEELDSVRAARQGSQAKLQQDAGARVEAMIEHLRRLDAANPEAVQRARALVAQRREVYELWLRSRGPVSSSEHRRIERRLQKVRRVTAEPGG